MKVILAVDGINFPERDAASGITSNLDSLHFYKKKPLALPLVFVR